MASVAETLTPDLSTLDLDEEIRRLKRERNAVILAHYYQESEIQDLADVIGDSLQLAQAARLVVDDAARQLACQIARHFAGSTPTGRNRRATMRGGSPFWWMPM